MADFDLITYNVRGLRDFKKRRKLFNYLKKRSSSQGIIFLQETHSTKEVEKFWKAQWGGQIMFSHGSNDSRAVLIAFREGLHFTVEKEMQDSKGRILMLKSVIQSSKYLLINLYNANTEQQQVNTLKEVSSMLDQIDLDSEYKLIWGGDFNFYFDLRSEADGGKPSIKLMSLAKFESIKQKLDLCDVWRIRNPNSRRFTYRSKSPFLQCRLDYLFISDSIQEDVNQIDILASLNSDHSPVYLKFSEGNETSRGPSYWKFNNSLLDDQHFVTSLTERIHYIIDNEFKHD